jgi:hypothetical protein
MHYRHEVVTVYPNVQRPSHLVVSNVQGLWKTYTVASNGSNPIYSLPQKLLEECWRCEEIFAGDRIVHVVKANRQLVDNNCTCTKSSPPRQHRCHLHQGRPPAMFQDPATPDHPGHRLRLSLAHRPQPSRLRRDGPSLNPHLCQHIPPTTKYNMW